MDRVIHESFINDLSASIPDRQGETTEILTRRGVPFVRVFVLQGPLYLNIEVREEKLDSGNS